MSRVESGAVMPSAFLFARVVEQLWAPCAWRLLSLRSPESQRRDHASLRLLRVRTQSDRCGRLRLPRPSDLEVSPVTRVLRETARERQPRACFDDRAAPPR